MSTSPDRVAEAAAALLDGHPRRALALLGDAVGRRADLVRIEALQHDDPDGELPEVQRRARRSARAPDDVARLLELMSRRYRGTRREVMLHSALEQAEDPGLRAQLMVHLGHRRLVVTDTQDAQRWLERAEAEGIPEEASSAAAHLRGVIHLHRGEHEDAIVHFSRSLTRAADAPLVATLALRARARAWASLDRLDKAQKDYQRALALTEGRPALLEERAKLINALADLARARGDLEEAARAFHALLALDIPFITPVVHLNLALVERDRGDVDAARRHLDLVALDGIRPFVVLAHAVTSLAVCPTGSDVGARVLAVERAVARNDHVDPDTMHTLAEALPALAEPEHRARVARIVLQHARVLMDPMMRGLAETTLGEAGVGLVGPYRVGGRLGEGASATVVRGVHLATRQEVALKVLDVARARRLRAVELDAVSDLAHPNLVPLVDHGVVDAAAGVTTGWPVGAPWLATSLVDGGAVEGTRSWEEVLGWLHDLLGALAHAHARGVLHLDIKPANILHTAAGEPLLTDFGIAARVGQRRRMRAYTPNYAASEQLAEHEGALGPWTDVYGLGATAWAWLVGASPRRAPSVDALPDEAAAWLVRATADDPRDRFRDVAEAWAALPPRPTPRTLPSTDRRERLAVRMRRGPPQPAVDVVEAMVDRVVDVMDGGGAEELVARGRPGCGHRQVVRDALQRAAEAGRLRMMWVDGDLRAGVAALVGPSDHLSGRPDVVDPEPLAAWLDGGGDVSAGLAGLARPLLLVREGPTEPLDVALPPGMVVLDLFEDDHGPVLMPAPGSRETTATLRRWLPELPGRALEEVAEQGSYDEAVDHLRALAALGRVVDTADGPSLLPGRLPSRSMALGAVVGSVPPWLVERPEPWCPDPVPDDVQPLLGRLLELGLARRGTAGWWLSRALWTAVAAEAPSG